MSTEDVGSPPRMRGKADCRPHDRGEHRITPAYAGKSLKYAKEEHGIEDHPRVCGEKQAVWCSEPGPEGSPPRMRGKVIKCTWGWYVPMDHPRVCGEKQTAKTQRTTAAGSPPRMRGKGTFGGCGAGPCGITPAYAGKSSPAGNCRSVWWDHPRVCGEKPERKAPRRPRLGSPPRMRGKETDSRRQCCSAGITPAYAGKSGPPPSMRRWSAGSPPRMRGKEHVQRCVLRTLQDHPRVCGEKLSRRVST